VRSSRSTPGRSALASPDAFFRRRSAAPKAIATTANGAHDPCVPGAAEQLAALGGIGGGAAGTAFALADGEGE
jgi:hypothetical protein